MSSKLLIIGLVGVVIVVAGGIFFLPSGDSDGVDNEVAVVDRDPGLLEACLKDSIAFGEYAENTIANYRGKPVVANSWATWCPFCINEMPDFAEVQREFGDEVVIVLIGRAESASQAQKFICELDIKDDLTYLLDPEDQFYKDISGFAMPETIFVDAEGVTQFQKRGFMTIEEMRQRIQDIL